MKIINYVLYLVLSYLFLLISGILYSQDDIRNEISALEMTVLNESERFASALVQIEKNKEARQELDKKFDAQYRRRM